MKKKTKTIIGIIIGLAIVIAAVAIFYPRVDKTVSGGTVGSAVPKPPPVGTIGQSLTALTPDGQAEFNNRSYTVTSVSGIINAHLPIRVESVDKNNRILVTRLPI